MAKEVHAKIAQEIKAARYFSISVDFTPDIAHVDQLIIVVRYISPSCHEPVMRFLMFLPIYSHTGENPADTLTKYLATCGLDIAHCRRQSYTNANNMSGQYSGMQARIRAINDYAIYIRCAVHSLNLVGKSAVDCCTEAVSFFRLVQAIYVFFSAFTKRWKTLSNALSTVSFRLPKRLSDTRWSAHANATAALHAEYSAFESTLDSIANDEDNNAECRHEARTLCNALGLLETALMSEVQNDVLQRFDLCSKSLQDAKIDVASATALLNSLADFLVSIRDRFDDYERRAIDLCGNDVYKADVSRVRRRKQQVDDGAPVDAEMLSAPRNTFRVRTFLAIIDKLLVLYNIEPMLMMPLTNGLHCCRDIDP